MARGVNQEAVKIEERRRKVLQLYLRHQTQAEIGRVLGVDQKTISNDIAAIRAGWKEANTFDFDAIKQREAAELDEMEAEQRERMRLMRDFLRVRNVYRWAGQMLLDASRLRSQQRIVADSRAATAS